LTDNLAEMGTAKQSSSYRGFNAAKALDGNRNQSWSGESCGHTAEGQTKAWWRLDIGQPANIYNIVIHIVKVLMCTSIVPLLFMS
jgi:hypothetical protein